MDTVKARARHLRNPTRQYVHYYCGGEGCRRKYLLAMFYFAIGPGDEPFLEAAEDFKNVDGIWRRVPGSGRSRGRAIAARFRHLARYDQGPDLEKSERAERALRRSQSLEITDLRGEHLFLCPQCGAANVVQAPLDNPKHSGATIGLTEA